MNLNYKTYVHNYFNFSSGIKTNINKYSKSFIHISGKPNKSTITFFLIFCIMMVFLYCACFTNPIVFTYNIKTDIFLSSILTILSAILAIIIVLIKSIFVFKKIEAKPTNINIYNRDLPSKLRPLHVRMLLNDGRIDELSIASTILDLIDRDYLKIENVDRNKINAENFFSNKKLIIYKTDKPLDNLLKYEVFLIEWFIKYCGNGKSVSNNELHDKLIDPNNSISTNEYFEFFQALAIISFPLNKYYNKCNFTKKRIIYALMIFCFFVPTIPFIGMFLEIYALGNLMFCTPMYILNQKGSEEKDQWLDLKKYLEDFSDIKNKTAEMIILWEQYLSYSVALNLKSIASKEITDFFGKNIYYNNGTKTTRKNINEYNTFVTEQKSTFEQIEKDIEEETKIYNLI